MKINLEGYELTGTPAEIVELLDLLAEEVAAVEKPAPAPETPEKPKPAPRKSGGKNVDWNKAKALRAAGWSFEKIGEELGVTGVTVRAHLTK